MKNVKTRILAVICGLVAVSLLTLGIMSIVLSIRTTYSILEQTTKETALIAADEVSNLLRVYKTIVSEAGTNIHITNPDASIEEKQGVIDNIVSEHSDFVRGNVLDSTGMSLFDGNNYSDREYFQKAISGGIWVSEPLVSKVTGAVTIIVAAPIWKDGIPYSSTVGVVYFVPVETFLNDIVRDIKISPGAGAHILNKSGTVIAHANMDLVANYNNNQENEKTDPSYVSIAALERSMMKGERGFGTYSMDGVDKFLAYAPIPDTDNWSIGVNAPINEFMGFTNRSIIYTVSVLAFFLLISTILAILTANRIGSPLAYLSSVLSNIAKTGSIALDEEFIRAKNEMLQRKDEIGSIAGATDELLKMLKHDADILNSIRSGDLTVDVVPLSDEDALGGAMLEMTSNLSTMFSDIHQTAELVSSGAKQISDGAQSLAQGSTEQASVVEALSTTMSEMADKTKVNAELAQKAATLERTIMNNAEKGSKQMNEMNAAVHEINEASQNINKVIKVIDDIAFQTNILALNAAVEAARAGQHGKGFAVVAEEVRNLASKSAEAAKDTGILIANSIEKAEFGARIADETAASLVDIVSGIKESSELINAIAKSSLEQSTGIESINKGIDQVSQVVQQNSATAEESAASSEEMSGQAVVLEDLVGRFKLKNDHSSSGGSFNNKPMANLPSPSGTSNISRTNHSNDYGKY